MSNTHTAPIVGVRLRPPQGASSSDCWDVEAATLKTVAVQRGISLREQEAQYTVDHIFDGRQASGAQNLDVFHALVLPLLDAAVANASSGICLCYGMTGATCAHKRAIPAGSQGLQRKWCLERTWQSPHPQAVARATPCTETLAKGRQRAWFTTPLKTCSIASQSRKSQSACARYVQQHPN